MAGHVVETAFVRRHPVASLGDACRMLATHTPWGLLPPAHDVRYQSLVTVRATRNISPQRDRGRPARYRVHRVGRGNWSCRTSPRIAPRVCRVRGSGRVVLRRSAKVCGGTRHQSHGRLRHLQYCRIPVSCSRRRWRDADHSGGQQSRECRLDRGRVGFARRETRRPTYGRAFFRRAETERSPGFVSHHDSAIRFIDLPDVHNVFQDL